MNSEFVDDFFRLATLANLSGLEFLGKSVAFAILTKEKACEVVPHYVGNYCVTNFAMKMETSTYI